MESCMGVVCAERESGQRSSQGADDAIEGATSPPRDDGEGKRRPPG